MNIDEFKIQLILLGYTLSKLSDDRSLSILQHETYTKGNTLVMLYNDPFSIHIGLLDNFEDPKICATTTQALIALMAHDALQNPENNPNE